MHRSPSKATDLSSVETALRWGRERLAQAETPSLDAQLLLSHVLKRSRSWVLAHGEAPLSDEDQERFASLIRRREAGEPVAYLRGHVEWYGRDWIVGPGVLVPRPETELLVERAIKVAREVGARVCADIGTGSGAIAVQLALDLPEARVYAVDVSNEALRVASRNAERHGVSGRVRFLPGSLLEPLPERPDLIVANLPYLSRDMMRTLPLDVRHEPPTALHGGETGTELYEALLRQMAWRGWRCPLLLEIDPRQTDRIRDSAARTLPDSGVSVDTDYAGHERVVELRPVGA